MVQLSVGRMIQLSVGRMLPCTLVPASHSHPDLNRAPYKSYGDKYIDLVSLVPLSQAIWRICCRQASAPLDLGDAPNVLYGLHALAIGLASIP